MLLSFGCLLDDRVWDDAGADAIVRAGDIIARRSRQQGIMPLPRAITD
jgi:hypothetical protein